VFSPQKCSGHWTCFTKRKCCTRHQTKVKPSLSNINTQIIYCLKCFNIFSWQWDIYIYIYIYIRSFNIKICKIWELLLIVTHCSCEWNVKNNNNIKKKEKYIGRKKSRVYTRIEVKGFLELKCKFWCGLLKFLFRCIYIGLYYYIYFFLQFTFGIHTYLFTTHTLCQVCVFAGSANFGSKFDNFDGKCRSDGCCEVASGNGRNERRELEYVPTVYIYIYIYTYVYAVRTKRKEPESATVFVKIDERIILLAILLVWYVSQN
jgi:hypothetical protein